MTMMSAYQKRWVFLIILLTMVVNVSYIPLSIHTPVIERVFNVSGSQSGTFDYTDDSTGAIWWLSYVDDSGLMKMCGDSHYPNWFGSYSRLTVGSLVTVNEPLKVRIGFYATLNAKILEGFPGTVWIKVFVTLLDESYNQIDYKRLLFKETDWTGSVDFTGYKHKLDSETTLQPNHNYYLCVKWEGYLQCTGYVHATDGTGYADLIISQILWSFY